jgi:predicted porin
MQFTKTRLGVAVGAALFSTSLYAQTTVQVYGIADAGVEFLNHARVGSTGTETGNLTRLSSGNAQSSRLGFRGREDLGGGLSALFVLENGFNIDDGTMAQGGRLFGRQAFVGLAGSFGEVQFGRQTNVIYDFGTVFDPLSGVRYSGTTFDAAYAGRADNALKYIGKFNGLNIRAQYSFGFDGTILNGSEVPGAYRVGKEFGVHADYTFGRFGIGAAYDRQNGTSIATQDNKTERKVIGATVNLDAVKLFGAYQRLTAKTLTASADTNIYWVGAEYKPTPVLTLFPTAYFRKPDGSDNRSSAYTMLASYALSKRTDVYSQVAYMKNQDLATLALGGTLLPGTNQTGVIVGVRHRF